MVNRIPNGYREAVAYLQIQGRPPGNESDWSQNQATAVRLTTTKPTRPISGAVVVKVRIQIPKTAFEPLQPEAIIQVPEDLVQRPILVDAQDPEDDA